MEEHNNRKLHNEIKNPILDTLIIVVLVLGIPALVTSYLSVIPIGHLPLFSTFGIAVLIVLIILRKKIHYLVKGWSLIIMGYVIGTLALWNEGILSDGLLYYTFIGIIASMLINIRSGVIVSVTSLITFALIGLAVSKGWHRFDFDIRAYFYSPKNWLAFTLTAALFIAVAVYIYGRMESYLVQYINELTNQSLTLTHSKNQLEKEITERKLADYQLKQSEIKFKKVFNSIGDGIILLRPDNTIHKVNDSFLKMTGYIIDYVINKPLESFFGNPHRISYLIRPDAVVTSLFNVNENWLINNSPKGGIPVEVRILPIKHEKEISSIAIIKDITGSKETETKIMHAVINSEEEERKRIAQDLHDSIGPYLSAAKLYVNSAALTGNDSKAGEIRKELSDLLGLAISSIREISGNLGSHILRNAGLRAALQSFIEKINVPCNISFGLAIPDESLFIENVEISLYRILVELINNSVKYSFATEISIRHSESGQNVVIEYLENGVGFNVVEALEHHKGMGLYNIQSRISSLGGFVEYESSPGKGVSVRITFNRNQTYKQLPKA